MIFFWKNVKVQYDVDFRILFDGKRGKKSDFCSLCLLEFTKREGVKITPLEIEDLKSRVWALSDKTQQPRSFLPTFNVESLRCYETASVLEKVIVGRADVDIANLVASLGNSDWVSNGRSYLHNSNGICPFCQQLLPADFEATLNHYFDDSYAKDIASLKKLKMDYEREAGSLINQFRGYCALCPELKNNQKFCNAGKLLVSTYEKNVAQLQKKILSPSLKIQLEETQGILIEILECVVAENEVIKRDNKLISEREAQTEILRRDFWDFLYVQLGDLFNALNDDLGMAQKHVDGLTKNIETKKDELTRLQKERSDWAALHSNVVPTITAINNQLQRLGFHSFTLAESGGDYALVRSDGAKANETLSEGERTLVTFLYFMERIYGADKGVALREERLVVIDDPISSLDAEVLFVVSSLVRNIMRDVESGSTPLKQMIILTHNIYFQKEITFCPNHDRELRKNRSYFLVTKTREGSKIEKCDENPVRTSYELLWKDFVREDRDDLSLQNTMRRILEYYFKILGRQNLDELYKRFEGVEQMICKSLISWINDGSHYPGDDLFYSIPNATIELYRHVFQKVFENTGNLPHYEMMMNAVSGGRQ